MTTLNIEKIQKKFPKRLSVLTYYRKRDASEINLVNDLLEKWHGNYEIIGSSGCEDAYHDLHILCTDAIGKELHAISCHDEWEEKGVCRNLYTLEEYEEANEYIIEGKGEPYQPIKLKKPLTTV